ncbi:MAG: NnrS family protein [Chloroflexota bacterium]|nr:NnrS family protein [Chloroflexota bacterium]
MQPKNAKTEAAEISGFNPFYLTAGLYFLLDALVLITLALVMAGVFPSFAGGTWVRVHLLTIGVVTQLILGALPGLTAAKLGTAPPSSRVTWVLWLLVNVSFVTLLMSMPAGLNGIAAVGATGVFAAIVIMLATIYRQVGSSSSRADAAVRLYVAGPIFFLVGILMALSMLLNWPAPGGLFGILEAHVHANVWGFLAFVVAGFLLNHVPKWTGAPLPFPSRVTLTAWLLIVGATGLVAGPWLAILPMTIAGIVIYLTGTALLLANIGGAILSARGWTPNLAHLAIAYVWMIVPAIVAPIILFVTGKLPTGAVESAAVAGLVLGWILQIVLGALPLRLNEERATEPDRNGGWFSVITLNLGVASIWLAAFLPDWASALTTIGFTLVFVGWLPPLVNLLPRLFSGPATAS